MAAVPGSASAAPGDALVVDDGALGQGTVFRVHAPLRGGGASLTMLKAGPPLVDPVGIALEPSGTAVISDFSAGPGGTGALFRFNPATGAIAPLASGPPLFDPLHVAVAPSGQIFVADQAEKSGSSGTGQVHQVNPATGAVTTLASGNPPLRNPSGITVEPGGKVYFSDTGDIPAVDGKIFLLDPATRGLSQVRGQPNLLDPVGLDLSPPSRFSFPAGLLYFADFGGAGSVSTLDPARGFGLNFVAFDTPTDDAVDVAVETTPTGLAVDFGNPTGGTGSIFRFDQHDGAITPLFFGPPLVNPDAIALEPPLCRGRNATVVGSTADDKLTGTEFDDVIVGLGGRDLASGGLGNDLICGGAQTDKMTGGPGNDVILGQSGNDKLGGGQGNDKLVGAKGKRDRCRGGKGRDRGKGCERGKL